jgi:hypothetical protein
MGDVGFHVGVTVRHRRELAQVFRTRTKPLPAFETIPKIAKALQDLLRPLAVLPEVRLGGLGL